MVSMLDSEGRLTADGYFSIRPDGKRNSLVVRSGRGEDDFDHERFDALQEIARGSRDPDGILAWFRHLGGTPKDIVATGEFRPILISKRFRELLEGSNATGWRSYPCTIEMPDGAILDDYEVLAVAGRSGPVIHRLSDWVTLPPPTPRGRSQDVLRGLHVEPDGWDGSDLFIPESSAYILCVERIASAIRQAKLTGVELTAGNDITYPESGQLDLPPKPSSG